MKKDIPIYELRIDEEIDDESEVSFISLVDSPAIMKDFMAFNEQQFVEPKKYERKEEFLPRCISYVISEGKEQDQAVAICNSIWEEHFREDKFEETYNDYPQAATENAKTALRWAEENGWGDCGTPVGKIRANQLAKKEPISRDTIARMAGFERHRQSSDRPLGEGCGRLMWLAWGGDEGIAWAQRKLKQIDGKFTTQKFSITNEEQRIISGPIMLADIPIYRFNEQIGEHYVVFKPETIKQIAIKFAKKKYQTNVNLMHDPEMIVEGVTMFESFIVDRKRGITPMQGFEDVPEGSWFGSFYVENEKVWEEVKKGTFKGFSVEGLFQMIEQKNEDKEIFELLEQLNELIKNKKL